MKTIKVKIAKKDGKLSVEADGFTGTDCLDATAKLEQALGMRDSERSDKPEMYQENPEQQQIGGA